MKARVIAICCLVVLVAFSARAGGGSTVMLGYGSSVPGWGKTSERVHTLDVLYRYCHVLNPRLGSGWYEGSHEFWIEFPISIILSDTDHTDRNDVGIIGLNFLLAWVFTGSEQGQPYLMLGGGPQYVLADIEGVGSDTPGNYQAGFGYRFLRSDDITVSADIRYHHISNLGFADPNVPLNSVKAYVGVSVSF